ncbi:MAG TPA: DUF1697 domain-containing protein, partial [Gemmatimonadales bacterium]|nr:DUF1697 domain-containing protein [Gemmatimonadales bacterium]
MPRYVALLRAVNLGPYQQVSMAALTQLLGELGFVEPRTVLQSGNIVFGAPRRSTSQLERTLATAMERRLAVATDFFVRTAPEWRDVVASNPFAKEAEIDPSRLVLMIMRDEPAIETARNLQMAITGSETMHVQGRHAYIVYPNGIGRSRLTTALIEKRL